MIVAGLTSAPPSNLWHLFDLFVTGYRSQEAFHNMCLRWTPRLRAGMKWVQQTSMPPTPPPSIPTPSYKGECAQWSVSPWGCFRGWVGENVLSMKCVTLRSSWGWLRENVLSVKCVTLRSSWGWVRENVLSEVCHLEVVPGLGKGECAQWSVSPGGDSGAG